MKHKSELFVLASMRGRKGYECFIIKHSKNLFDHGRI